jgi:hypothetical protein
MTLTRKNVMVDAAQLKRLAKRLGVSESEAIRHSVDGLLHYLEIEAAAERVRGRGGLDEAFYRGLRGSLEPGSAG